LELIITIISVKYPNGDFMKFSLIAALSAAMALSAYGQSAEWIARHTGNPLSLTKKALAMGYTYDPSTQEPPLQAPPEQRLLPQR
jgi:hypothetical protein